MKCMQCKNEVQDNLFCSITCACMAGFYNIKTGWKYSQDELKQLKHIRDMEAKGYTSPYCDY